MSFLMERLYEDLESQDLLVDYFFSIGLNEKILINLFDKKYSDEEMVERLNIQFPCILSRFPPENKKDFQLDKNVLDELPSVILSLEFEFSLHFHLGTK